jgi:DNA-directed RNA polymerase specialized sigma24 family protein
MDEGIEDLDNEALKREITAENDEIARRQTRLRSLIREARRRGMTQAEIGNLMGISQPAVSQREKLIRESSPTE